MSRHILLGMLATVLVGCATTSRQDAVSDLIPPLQPRWHNVPAQSPEGLEEVPLWWERFADPQMQALIRRASEHNYDLKAAAERVRRAQALVTISRSAWFPQIDGIANAARQRTHTPPPVGHQTNLNAGFSGSWEVDIFGANQLATAATVAEAQATAEARRDFAVGLTAAVASAYVDLRGLERQRIVFEQNATARADTLHLTQARYRAGLATDLDVAQAEAQWLQVEALLPDVDRQINNELGELAILTGSTPEEIDQDLLQAAPIPVAPPILPLTTPASLLERRPDLRRARREVESAAANLGVARADRFPNITLVFASSVDQLKFRRVPTVTDSLYEIGAGVFWPLFDAGRIRANIIAKDAALRESADVFVQALLRALQDVESAYTDVRGQRRRSDQLQAAVAAARRSLDLANSLYSAGEADFLAVLDAQTQLLAEEQDLVVADTNASLACVSLYRALGGGWDVSEPTAAARP